MISARYAVRKAEGKYPIAIVDTETGDVVGRYYERSREAARDHCRDLNEGRRKPPNPLAIRGVRCRVGVEYLHYHGVDMNEFRVPRSADWSLLRAAIDDAERRASAEAREERS